MEKTKREKLREKSKKIKPKREKLKENTNELKNQTSLDKLFDKIKERKENREKIEDVSQVMVCDHVDTFTGRPSKCSGRPFQITASSTDRGSYGAHVRTHNANDAIYELADDPKYREEHSTAIMVKKWVSDHS